MRKLFFILSFLFVANLPIYPQYSRIEPKSKSGFDLSKLSIGGSFNLQFGDYTSIGISPQVGYDFSKYLTLGTGLGYTYFKDKDRDYKWSRSYLTYDIFARFYPIENIVLSVEPEISRMWETYEYRNNSYHNTKFISSVLVGGGFRYMGMIAMIQYDLVQDKYSPYGDRLFYSVGYTFNF